MWMLRPICGFVKLFTGVQVRWLGVKPEPIQRIYFANHTSHFDCMVLLSVLPRHIRNTVRPAAAADYWTATPFRCWFAQRVVQIIPIERAKVTRANNPIKEILAALDDGKSLIIFPEGGRNNTQEMQEFKSGLYHLSKRRPDIELVPTYIENANRILPKGEIIPIPMLCSVTFGTPIHLLPGETRDEFLSRAKLAVERCAA